MYVFNTLEVSDRKYDSADAKKIIPISHLDLDPGFYGGRIKYIGKTDTDVVLLMTDANTVIDTGAFMLDNIPIETIQKLCRQRKFEFHHKTGKDKLIDMLRG